ncbi:MAG TPA: MFS transporter, partial [Arthrobacter sp.]
MSRTHHAKPRRSMGVPGRQSSLGLNPVRHRARNGARLSRVVAFSAAVLVLADSSATAAVLVALPGDGIAEAISLFELTLMNTLHLLAVVGILAAAGGVYRRLGHRRALGAGLALFGLGGAASAGAPVWAMLLAGRTAQGVAAALLLPATLRLVMRGLPSEHRRRALARWGCGCGVGSLLGLTGAGPLVGSLGWRTVYLLAAVVAFALWATLTTLTTGSRAQRKAVARPGPAVRVLAASSHIAANAATKAGRLWGRSSPRAALSGVVALVLAAAGLVRRACAGHDSAEPEKQRHPGWSGLSSCVHGGIWLILAGLGTSLVRPAGVEAIQRRWLLPMWLGLTVAAPLAAWWGRRHRPMAVLYGTGLAALATSLLLVMMARTHQPVWGSLAAALVGSGMGALLTFTADAEGHRPGASGQTGTGAALASARLLAGTAAVNGAASYLAPPVLGERSGHAGVLFGAVGLISLLATTALAQAIPAIHAARRAKIALPAAEAVIPPPSAED